MPPIARIGLVRNVPPEAAQESIRNLEIRFVPTLTKQDGFILGLWASNNQNHTDGLSFVIFRDAESARAAGIAANSEPLQPGQNADNLHSPDEVYNCALVSEIDHGRSPSIARLAFTGVASESDNVDEEIRWLHEEFIPFLTGLPGLCQAYMLFDFETRNRFSLTFWESAAVLEESTEAVMQWNQRQAGAGRRAAFRPLEVLTYEVILHFVRGAAVRHPSA